MFLAVGLAYVAGVAAALFLGRRIVALVARGAALSAADRRFVARMGGAGAFVGFVPALLLGAVIGGAFGSASSGGVAQYAGSASAGSVMGAALGTFAVVTPVMCLSIAVGSWIGRILAGSEE